MSTGEIKQAVAHELSHIRKDWWCFLILGILLVFGGITAITYPFLSSLGIVMMVGAILVVCGVSIIISAFWAGRWSAFLVNLLIGVLYTVVGLVITDAPAETATLLTLMIASFLMIVGAFRVVAALVEKFPQWGWALLNGVITLLLGLIIFRNFRSCPEEAFWIIGLLVGVELLFNGWTWIMLSIAIRRAPLAEGTNS